MLSFVNKKTSSATLAEWNPSDWPESLAEMRTIDNLLRCSICYEYFDVAMIVSDCSHNYCSLCIRRSLSYESQCPTCKLKINPPSLKSNRVLDELVKNFINVRAKLLELVTREQQTASEDTAHRKGGETKNRSNNSSTKRRKAHTRPENSSNPDTKRQKLEDTGKVAVAKLVETADNSKFVASCSDSVPDVVVIETEDKPSRNLTPKQEPMIVDEGVSENQTSQASMDSDLAECPVCGDKIPHRKINSHLDACLTRTEKKSSLRRKRSAEPKSICSTLTKKKHLPSVETKESDATSSDDSVSCRATQELCSSGATSRSSTIMTKGSNALIQTVQKRKPLPKLVYSVMAEKDLRQRLKEWNLSTKGDKATLVKRHQDFVMLYNAQCDAAKPMTAAQIAREVEKAEKTRAKEASSLTEASTSGLRFDKNQSEEDMDKIRQKYMSEHEDEFSKLIADIRQRQGGKKKKETATKTSECLDAKTNDPGVNLVHPESSDSGNTKTVGMEVKSNIPKNSDLCLETSPPHLDAQNRDLTTLNKHESSSVFIPEPPSSPSLLSLPDDDEEFTPSLGLGEGDDGDDDDDDDDDECKDVESRDVNVIPESPVIKVGKSADGMEHREMQVPDEASSNLPQQQPSASNKRVKSSLF